MNETFLKDKHMPIQEKKWRLSNYMTDMYRIVNELQRLKEIISQLEREALPILHDMYEICFQELTKSEDCDNKQQ